MLWLIAVAASGPYAWGEESGIDTPAAPFAGVATLPFYETFDSGALGSFWAVTGTGPFRTQVTTSNSPLSASFHLTMDSSVNGANARNEATLALDLSGFTNVVLRCWIKSFNDGPNPAPPNPFTGGADFDGIAISTNGTTWHVVQQFQFLPSTYTPFTFNLDATLSQFGLSYSSNFFIRLNQFDNFSIPSRGLAFDHLSVVGVRPGIPSLTISDVSMLEGTGTNSVALFNVKLAPPSTNASPVTVAFQTVDGTARAGSDYVATNGTLAFLPGETNKVIAVTILGDPNDEADEYFRVTLSAPVGALLADTEADGVILNDDKIVVTTTNAPVIEGDFGTTNLVVSLKLSKAPTNSTVISYSTFDNTASAGVDYVATSGSVTIPVGVTNASFVVPVLGDVLVEGTENFYIFLGGPTNVIFTSGLVTATILDDDGQAGKLDHFVWSSIASPQKTGAPFPVTITAIDGAGLPLTNYSGPAVLSARGSAGEIYRADFETSLQGFTIDNSFLTGSGLWHLSTGRGTQTGHSASHSLYYGRNEGPDGGGDFDAGDTEGVVVSPLIDLAGASGPLTLSFNYLLQTEGGTTFDHALVEISTNNGTSFALLSGTSQTNSAIVPTGLNWRTASVNVSAFAGQVIRLRFHFDTVDGVANNFEGWYLDDIVIASTFSPLSMTPTNTGSFTNGVWSGALTVLQASPTVELAVGDRAGHTNRSGQFGVFDGPSLLISGFSIDEGAVERAEILNVTLIPPATNPVTVQFATVENTAYAGEDFIATNGVLTFQPGETNKAIPIIIRGDPVPELDESFQVVLSNPGNAVILRGTASVVLRNDDTYPPLTSRPRADFWQVNGTVNTIVEGNGVFYVGGTFTETSGTNTGNLIAVDRASGELLPDFPIAERTINAIVADGQGGWFVSGSFFGAGGLSRLRVMHVLPDRTVDPKFSPSFNNTVNVLAFDGANLYCGGTFTSVTNAGTVYARTRFAILDRGGKPGSLASNPAFDNSILALAVTNGIVWAGGSFLTVSNELGVFNRARLAAIDLATGQPTDFAKSPDDIVNALVLNGSRLFVGGDFDFVDTTGRAHLAAFDTATGQLDSWNPALNGSVIALLPANGALFVGGTFTNITNGGVLTLRSNLAALDLVTGAPTVWNPGASGAVRAFALDGDELFVGGSFTTFGGVSGRRRLASVDVNTGLVSAFDPDPSGNVLAIGVRDGTVFAGGAFGFVKGVTRNRIAAYDTTTGDLLAWNPNANGAVSVLTLADGELVVGGTFTSVGGQTRQRLAALNLATGLARANFSPAADNNVRALAVDNGTLYAGGDFTNVAGLMRRGVAAITLSNGAVVSNFVADAVPNAGATSNVLALAVDRATLYVGGAFTNLAGAGRSRAGAIDLTTGALKSWQPAFPTNVLALAAWYSNIYVGGEFTNLVNTSGSSVTRNRLAAIGSASGDATAWNPNANNSVFSLVVAGTNVYAGGNFTSIGARTHNRLAELNPLVNGTNASAWTPDVNSSVLTLASGANGRIYAGGALISVNLESRRNFAVFESATAPSISVATNMLTFVENDPPTPVDSSLVVHSPDSTFLTGAIIRFAASYTQGEDRLDVSVAPGISGAFDAASGRLALAGAAAAAVYESVLRSVTYFNTSENPATAVRSIEFRVTSDAGSSAPVARPVAVIAVNDPPSFDQGPDQIVAEDSGQQAVVAWATNILAGPPEEAGQSVMFITTNNNPSLFATPPSISPAGMLAYTPAPDANGTAIITVTLMDDGGTANGGQDKSTQHTFTITVTPVNDPPTARSLTVTLNEDTPTPIHLLASDMDGDLLTYLVTAPAHGAVSGAAPNLLYTPATNFHGPDSFTYRVSDGQAESDLATVSLTILSVNDPPVADASATLPVFISPNNSNAVVVLDGSRSSDAENDPLHLVWRLAGNSNALATGVVAMATLPVGTNQLLLVVSDGQATSTDAFTLEVITAAEAVRRLQVQVTSSVIPRNVQPLLASLDAARASFARGNFTSGANQLEAFQNKVRAQVAPDAPTLAEYLIELAQEIIEAVLSSAAAPAPFTETREVTQGAAGMLKLHFSGRIGRVYLIEASTNLVNWEVIGSARRLSGGLFEFEDPHVSPMPRRFYRIIAP
ncbi:MAG TPA: Calx-beta domain-containing protein [Verrucomicrobiae bacterium]